MSTTPSQPTNVLVVEDEMVLRMRAVDIVEEAGFTAVEGHQRRSSDLNS